MKCALLDKNGGMLKENPAGSLSKILNPLSAYTRSPGLSCFNTPQWSTIAASEVDPGNNSDVNTTAPFGAAPVKVFTVCLLL